MRMRCQRWNIKTPGNVLRNLKETLEKNWRGRAESSFQSICKIHSRYNFLEKILKQFKIVYHWEEIEGKGGGKSDGHHHYFIVFPNRSCRLLIWFYIINQINNQNSPPPHHDPNAHDQPLQIVSGCFRGAPPGKNVTVIFSFHYM